MNFFGKKKKTKTVTRLKALRPCHGCGSERFSPGSIGDVVDCVRCGCIYYIGSEEPVAKYERVEV